MLNRGHVIAVGTDRESDKTFFISCLACIIQSLHVFQLMSLNQKFHLQKKSSTTCKDPIKSDSYFNQQLPVVAAMTTRPEMRWRWLNRRCHLCPWSQSVWTALAVDLLSFISCFPLIYIYLAKLAGSGWQHDKCANRADTRLACCQDVCNTYIHLDLIHSGFKLALLHLHKSHKFNAVSNIVDCILGDSGVLVEFRNCLPRS